MRLLKRSFFITLFAILLLNLISGLAMANTQQNIDAACVGDEYCRIVYEGTETESGVSAVCGGSAQFSISDATTQTPIAGSIMVTIFDGQASRDLPELSLNARDPYRYFSYLESGGGFPIVTHITFSATGYATQVYEVDANNDEPCKVKNGGPVGGIVMQKESG